ncbi:TIGR02757 family protein [Pedobacter sp. SYSU D00535]|uniref:TIGR02757 family protein n=1 Tax=Pedobacter sp. SYSU D00535 TaxID=2810308 RepID=UPI001A95EA9A|nr:TIGR02757 family protein [Pedobacter sp. SYSU D00535]
MVENLKAFLDHKVEQYNAPDFIPNDPVVIPHQFKLKQDIEIMGFFAAVLAWGQRKTIISKCKELAERMDNAPFEFVKNHREEDLKALLGFKHRTFNDTDLLYFIHFFKHHFDKFDSLEDAFLPSRTGPERTQIYREEFIEDVPLIEEEISLSSSVCYTSALQVKEERIEQVLNHFRAYFFSLPDFPRRTIKHVSSPSQKSTCKRLNMFLRWMVRKDNKGVDFGIWNRISPAQLICPCDLHVERVARKLNLITRKQVDWQTAIELTRHLRTFDPLDPVKYDFALFGLGIEEKFY